MPIFSYGNGILPIGRFMRTVIDVMRDMVEPVPGSIIKCDLLIFEHTGVYIGDGKIVHLLGDGLIMKDSPSVFIDGYNALHAYVACDRKTGLPLGSIAIAERAKKMIGSWREYHLARNNCHKFSSECINGDTKDTIKAFWMLERTISKNMNNNKSIDWRIWDHNDHYISCRTMVKRST